MVLLTNSQTKWFIWNQLHPPILKSRGGHLILAGQSEHHPPTPKHSNQLSKESMSTSESSRPLAMGTGWEFFPFCNMKDVSLSCYGTAQRESLPEREANFQRDVKPRLKGWFGSDYVNTLDLAVLKQEIAWTFHVYGPISSLSSLSQFGLGFLSLELKNPNIILNLYVSIFKIKLYGII